MKGVTKYDLAYAAGLFDGEGSYIIAKHFAKTKHCGKRGWVWELRMAIGMSDIQGLEFLRKKFHKRRLRVTTTGKRKFYHLTFYSNEIRKFLPVMLPYIQVKKKQAKLLLRALSIIRPKSNLKSDKKLEKMYLKMKILNHSRHKPI